MKIIENGLIPVYENESKEQLVNARELHEFLGVKRYYTQWIETYIKLDNEYGFVENVDFTSINADVNPTNGVSIINHILTIDMAKELSMLSKTKKGKDVRKYFINIEKKSKEKQFESLEHFQKEQFQLGFVMDKLNLSDSGKIKFKHILHRWFIKYTNGEIIEFTTSWDKRNENPLKTDIEGDYYIINKKYTGSIETKPYDAVDEEFKFLYRNCVRVHKDKISRIYYEDEERMC